MEHWLTIPHRSAPGLCPVNGIRDLIQWRTGLDLSNEFLFGLAQGGGFAYLRFNFADPPRQVYWGTASPRQHKYIAQLLNAGYVELENRSFKTAWKKAQACVDAGIPPILGPLDMFYLHFYPAIYQQRHIPIHYLLLVGYDSDHAYVQDTGREEVDAISIQVLEQGWDVHVPGLGKRNRWVSLDIPHEIAPVKNLVKKSIHDACAQMLTPPVSMLGIPAMEKLSREIAGWPEQLGNEAADKSLCQVREYLNSPPDLMGNHLTAGRDIFITFLEQAADMAGLDFSPAIELFRTAMDLIPGIAEAIRNQALVKAGADFAKIAQIEKEAYRLLSGCVGDE